METKLPKYTLYCLSETDRTGLRYFGVTTKKLYARLREHIAEAKTTTRLSPKVKWIRSRLSSGHNIKILRIRRFLDIEDASRLESRMVSTFKTSFNLVNSAPGGIVKAHGKSAEGIKAWLKRRIKMRIYVIDHETTVREAVIWNFDSTRSARRKLRAVLAA